MNNVLLTTDGRSPAEVEKRLRRYLPGLDTRLWPLGPTQAVLRAPIVKAIRTDYPDLGRLLQALGVTRIDPIDDETAVRLLALRDLATLPPRTRAAALPARGTLDWHLEQSNVPAAWTALGGPGAIDWGPVKVGHIDTGYTEHPAFGFGSAGGTWIDLAMARTFVPDPPAQEASIPSDEPGSGRDNLTGTNGGHGTRIGATICGHAPNAPGGAFYGVAPKVSLVPARITNSVWINHRQREFGEAVRHLIGPAGATVINVSLGVFGAKVMDELRDALNAAYDAGVIVVCAAGNVVNPVVAPARLSRTLAVGGVTAANRPWSGSSYGPQTDFSSYADGIRRAHVERGMRFGYAGGGDGTSYATAITTGAAALWLARRGAELDAAYPQPWQRVEAFRTLARQTTRVPTGWQPGSFGTGVLDVAALLEAELPPAASTPDAAA